MFISLYDSRARKNLEPEKEVMKKKLGIGPIILEAVEERILKMLLKLIMIIFGSLNGDMKQI